MHTTDLPNHPPTEITIGTTLEWEKEFSDFPADEWTVTYYFRGAGPGFNAVGVADDTAHIFTVPSSVSDDLVEGRYDYQAFATKDSESHLVDEGVRLVKKSLADIDSDTTYDSRSRNRKILDALDALMEGKASLDQQKYLLATGMPGFSSQQEVDRIDPLALLELRKYYAALVANENRRKKKTVFRTIKTHIHPASR